MGIIYKKISLFWGDFSNSRLYIVYMSRRGLKLKVDQSLVEASFKLENISEDMKNELKTSAKEFGNYISVYTRHNI